MFDILKIAGIFTLILILLRFKWNVGYVLLAASGALALFYLMPLNSIFATVQNTITDTVTIKLFLSLCLIRVFEIVLREKDALNQMTEASKKLLKKGRAVIISMPMLIGMMPSLGGAYFSAPMVEEATKGLNMPPEEKAFINYWFRHPWECILPLYPGILLASALTKIELRSFIAVNMIYAVIIVITGFMLSMRNIGRSGAVSKMKPQDRTFLWSFVPLCFVIVLVMFLHVELHYALAISTMMLFLFYKYAFKDIVRVMRHGFAKEVIIIVLGTMLFKFMMENSGAVTNLSYYFTEKGILLLPVLFLLPFISGLLTGITVAFIGSTFPLLISIAGGAHLNEMAFAFAAGYVGVLLSPVHLCLVLTREYFKADVTGVYKKIIPGCIAIMAGALAVYFIL
jgi:integral membrane protein (TIGR00529 family)